MAEERFKIIPAVYLVLIKDDKILLLRRYNTGYFDGYYSFPAGHLDGKETLKQAMIREAKEEVGIELNKEDLELIHVLNRKIPGNERVDFFFSAKKYLGEPKIAEPDKCDDLSWFSFDDLPENTVPWIKQTISLILNKVIYNEIEREN